jgi:hypothetical protein
MYDSIKMFIPTDEVRVIDALTDVRYILSLARDGWAFFMIGLEY